MVLAFMSAGGGYLWLRTSLPQLSGDVIVNDPDAVVEIIRDRNAIPHIRAQSSDDAYYALGFVHAQDRLFQMDFMRRLGAGRLSEVVGPPTIGVDRMMRTLGVYRLAEASLAELSEEARRAFAAYADGVNAYLKTHPGGWPPEFQALRYRPEPWRQADSLVWGRLMAMRLSSNWRTEALRARLSRLLPPERMDELWPGDDGDTPPTITALANGAMETLFAGLVRVWPAELRPVSASNSWAVSGAQTASGKPVLANDPHLGFRAPGLWYLARIEAPGLILTGATVAGVPLTILGHNGRVAWGFTTTESDTQDLFVERIDPADSTRYLAPGGSRPFETRKETIRVRGREPVTITVRETRHGPVISDAVPRLETAAGPGHVVALAAMALRADDRTSEAVFRLNRVRDWKEFKHALRDFHAPQQNITYADTDGNIGFLAPGRVPIRKSGKGRAPAPGWSGSHDWIGVVPFEALPQAFNPPSGRIVNANHKVVADDYPYYLGHRGTPSYRARRIHDLLDRARDGHTPRNSTDIQTDTVSLMARELVPLMSRLSPADARSQAVVRLIRNWRGEMDKARPEPLIFIAWLREFNRALYADELGPAFGDYWGLRPKFVKRVLTGRESWCDDTRTSATESCDMLLETALTKALSDLAVSHGEDMSAWRWGEAHFAHFRHPMFGRLPMLRRFADLQTPSDGGAYTVNRAQPWTGDTRRPFVSAHGPGFRAVYDLSDLDATLFMQATGQSGNPLSAHYGDRIVRWRDGEYLTIASNRAAAIDGAIGVLNLTPQRTRESK